jgi:hypothetical protein
MSTIRHPVQNHAWWYAAAAAVLAGLLAVLMVSVFPTSSASVAIQKPPPRALHYHAPYGSPCFAGRPGGSIELLRTGCQVGSS